MVRTIDVMKLIAQSNQAMHDLYPLGINYAGVELKYYTLKGYRIWAITEDQAKSILQQSEQDIG